MNYSVIVSIGSAAAVLRFETYELATRAGDELFDAYKNQPTDLSVVVADGRTVCWSISQKN